MTAQLFITAVGILLLLYISCGILFAIAFLLKGLHRVDETTHSSTWGFRLIIIPGIVALWPALLMKWIRSV